MADRSESKANNADPHSGPSQSGDAAVAATLGLDSSAAETETPSFRRIGDY